MSMSSYVQFITVLIIFIGVLVLTYYATKWLANYQKVRTTGGNIEVVETARISTNKYIQIIRLGDKYMAVAVGKDEITALCELDREVLNFKETQPDASASFKDVLDKIKSEIKK